MNHRERLDADQKIVMEIEYDGLTAYCGPETSGEVYVEDEQVGKIPPKDFTGVAPFRVDLVFESYPTKGEVKERLPQIEQEFSEQFDQRVDEVYNLIEDSDDPLDTIMDLEPEDLSP